MLRPRTLAVEAAAIIETVVFVNEEKFNGKSQYTAVPGARSESTAGRSGHSGFRAIRIARTRVGSFDRKLAGRATRVRSIGTRLRRFRRRDVGSTRPGSRL